MKPTKTNFQRLIEKVKADTPKLKERSTQALEWYQNKIETTFGSKTQDPLNVYETQPKKILSFAGQIITFKYTPKEKATLSYYDTFPLVLTLSMDTSSMLALNFHYLKPLHRIMFMSELYKYVGTKLGDPVVRIDYEMLLEKQALRYYRPCIKRYLFKNISPQISVIPQEEWELALFLPTEKFISNVGQSTNKQKIWERSFDLIRKR